MPQINLYYTDTVSNNDHILQHNCLRISPRNEIITKYREITLFCMNDLPSIFNIDKSDPIPKFTFAQLSKQNITSQQLYLWSAPIDLIENYQFYLNQLSTINNTSSLENEVFYNCTLPRFGPLCQYQLPYHHAYHLSLDEIIQYFYSNYKYNSITLICYIHLECHRGPHPTCLDWKEICDGKVDCLNDGVDEKYCWELEINECQNNEYRCRNGQCIPQSFYDDGIIDVDCIDTSDEPLKYRSVKQFCQFNDVPSFSCEDLSNLKYTTYNEKRTELLIRATYSTENSSISDDCWSAFKCFLNFIDSESLFCRKLCKQQSECMKIIRNKCPDIIVFPNTPVLFTNVYFIYRKDDLQNQNNSTSVLFYICYTKSQYDNFFINSNKIYLNNMTCIHSEPYIPSWLSLPVPVETLYEIIIKELSPLLIKYHLPFSYTSIICNRTSMYQCIHSSKCISLYRLLDNINDCPYMDDEDISLINNTRLQEHFNKTHFECPISGKYIPQSFVNNENCDCERPEGGWCADEHNFINYIHTNVIFQYICDGFIDFSPKSISEQNHTDETECEQWKCNNIYTRCNGIWNCLNGEDESGCFSHLILNCSSKHHLCVLPSTNQFICLPIEKANDGQIDCLGATDEITRCGKWIQIVENVSPYTLDFYCMNQSSPSCIFFVDLCNGFNNCEDEDDEQFCTDQTIENDRNGSLQYDYSFGDIKQFLHNYRTPKREWSIIPFQLDGLVTSIQSQIKSIENKILSSPIPTRILEQHQSRCHRGLDLQVWLNNDKGLANMTCLCPPSYYGNQCQYQNQRFSLTIQFRALSTSRQTHFAIVILLIDDTDQRIIHSHEQISFLSLRDCNKKINVYLLYSKRPKHSTNNYAIHIDFYEKTDPLQYRGSVLLPIRFSFLPVHRLSFIINIPRPFDDQLQRCSNDRCIHGQCIPYSNNLQNLSFCQCHEGWSGKSCTIQHKCTCSSDSKCIGISAINHRSICVCPSNKFGPRCLLTDTTCQTKTNDTCQHDGQCISNVEDRRSNEKFICICPKGFSGDRCEIIDNQLILSFDKQIVLSQSISIHFINVISEHYPPNRVTTLRVIPLRQDAITVHWSQPFHLVFTERNDKKLYYLTVVQKIYNRSTTINKTIHSSDHCPNITELFNQTFLQWPLIRRIKYYHLPCQNQLLNLSCFHDEQHFCLCYEFEQQRLANCFKFDHHMSLDCFGQNECENSGQCLQDKKDCPTTSICMCPPCYYGRRCQFTTNGFGLSLDAILGYHIIPNHSLNQQLFIIKMSVTLVVIFMIIGLVNGIFCLITFKNKIVCEVGCGIYLLGSSITTLITMIMFGLKFLILLLAQMSIISNRTFLQVQCHSMDFVLQVCLCMDQWLNACVSFERALTIIKATSFDKKQSKRTAKYVILIVLIIIIGSCIHDPISRRLIEEENDIDNEKRIWCIVKYSSSVEMYNYFIYLFHFFGPFLVNLLSAITFITKKSHQQTTVHVHRSYREIFREQVREHKHLLIAPIALVILALPRLIIIFISKCMKSSNDVWLFLMGYIISFIPPMLTFLVFIVPSKFYKKQFHKTVDQYRVNIRRYLSCISSR